MSIHSLDQEIIRWMNEPGSDAEQTWDVFLKSLPNRERNENGFPKGLDQPERYGPAGEQVVVHMTTSFASQNGSNASLLSECGRSSPTQELSLDDLPNEVENDDFKWSKCFVIII